MPSLFIFNPDTDYALADAAGHYNPPARIEELRSRMAFTQLPLASEGDAVCIRTSRDIERFRENGGMLPVGVETVMFDRIGDWIKGRSHTGNLSPKSGTGGEIRICPWGWNPTLRRQLLAVGVSEYLLPTPERLSALRELAHRRTTIAFNKALLIRLPQEWLAGDIMPRELTSVDEAMDWIAHSEGGCYLKAPWSSSGRGVVSTSGMTGEKLRQWISGTIRRQGSVMGERDSRKRLDFATEWEIIHLDNDESEVRFLGFSVFDTNVGGGYQGNFIRNSDELKAVIVAAIPDIDLQRVVETQAEALCELVAPVYGGPLGIDMLADTQGRLRPCVELNLRTTMGHIALAAGQKKI